MKIKYYVQSYGSILAIGIAGNNEDDIIQAANSLYNYKATNGDPIFISDKFAYILTDEHKLFQGLYCKALSSLQKTRCNKRILLKSNKRVSVLPFLASEKAKRQIAKLIKKKFIHDIGVVDNLEPYQTGNHDFENSDEKATLYANYKPSLKFDS